MKVDFMQRVDYYFGIPLCFLMSIIRLILSPFSYKKNLAPTKILFIELSEMGSAVIAYSSLCKAQEIVGRTNVYFLIFERNRESVELLHLIPNENIIIIKDRSLYQFFISAIRALLTIRRLKIDTTLDLELFSRCTALISFLSGARIRVGFDNYCDEGLYRGRLFTHYVLYNGTQHMALNFLALVCSISEEKQDLPLLKLSLQNYIKPFPSYNIDKNAALKVATLLGDLGYDLSKKEPLLVVNPDPGLLELRGWPLDKFCQTVKSLIDEIPNLRVGIIGLERSNYFYEKIAAGTPDGSVIDLTGKTDSLAEVLALLVHAKCLLTNDSGPAHMASLINLPTVVLFGPETPIRYSPLGENVIALSAGLSCSPCFSASNHRRSICKNNVCMQAITTDKVLESVRISLNR